MKALRDVFGDTLVSLGSSESKRRRLRRRFSEFDQGR